MSKMSLLDKLQVLFDVSKSSKLFILIGLILIALGLSLSLSNPKSQKKQKMALIMITVFITVFAIISYHASLGKMLSYMMNNLFIVVFFPNLAVYLAAIVITNIILWVSIFSFKSAKPIRNLNIVIYTVITYIMILLLSIINDNNLDVFSQEAIYSNKQASALISISSYIFMIWIVFLVLYKLILIYLKKDYAPKVRKIIIKKKVKKFPVNYIPQTFPDYVYGNAPKRTSVNTTLKDLESRFTLQDYKLFSKILREQNEENQLTEKNNLESFELIQEPVEIPKTREEQKQEIIRMEEERRKLLEKQKNNKKVNQPKLEQAIPEIIAVQPVEQKIEILEEKKENKNTVVGRIVEKPTRPVIKTDKNKEQEEREKKKYTELEMLYRGIC